MPRLAAGSHPWASAASCRVVGSGRAQPLGSSAQIRRAADGQARKLACLSRCSPAQCANLFGTGWSPCIYERHSPRPLRGFFFASGSGAPLTDRWSTRVGPLSAGPVMQSATEYPGGRPTRSGRKGQPGSWPRQRLYARTSTSRFGSLLAPATSTPPKPPASWRSMSPTTN